MPKYLEKKYLDSSVIMAYLQNEQRPNNEMLGVEYCMKRIMDKEIKAITSTITRGEILEGKFPPGTVEQFNQALSKRRSFEWVNLDNRVSEILHDIRNHLISINKKRRL